MATGARPQEVAGLHRQGLLGSMRVRIVLTVVVLLALSAGVSIALVRTALRSRLDEEITVALQREAEEFEILATGRNPETGQPFDGDFRAVFDVYFEREVPDEGETLLSFIDEELYATEHAANASPAADLEDATAHWLALTEKSEGTIRTAAGSTRYVAVPLAGPTGAALFVAANFPAEEQREIDEAVRNQALVQFAMIVIASLLGLALAGRVLRPLRSLADTAQTFSTTDLSRRIPVHGDDEASRIASTFNAMLERIERSFATQRQFLDDASHELRSPMTVIRGHVELLEFETDPEERAAIVSVITEEIDRMNRIVEDLLLLARSERPGFLTREPIAVAALIEDVHRRAAVLCDREWSVDASPNVTVRADRQLLTQAMVQLAQNVCQHTPPGTAARIGATADGDEVVLWVADDGPGVPGSHAQQIFHRFVKGSEQSDGSGLGLSIVAAIADAHGGRARLAPAPVGARFEIVLPRDRPTAAGVVHRNDVPAHVH